MAGGWIAFGVVAAIIVVALIILVNNAFIVHQTESIVIERLGKFDRILDSGLSFKVPFIEQAKAFPWARTVIEGGRIVDQGSSDIRIDKREAVFNFQRQEVYTKDTILLDVNSIMYYRITDVRKAVYEVVDLRSAVVNLVQTQLKEVFGRMTFLECMTGQDAINTYMKEAFAQRCLKWGIKVERMELLDISPRSAIASSMKKQMVAERERRGQYIIAEGEKTAMKIISDGTRIVKQNNGLGEQEATRKISEGQAKARVEVARAESQSLSIIQQALRTYSRSQSQYMLSLRYLELLSQIGYATKKKVIVLPYEAEGLQGLVSQLDTVYGRGRHGGDGRRLDANVAKSEETQPIGNPNGEPGFATPQQQQQQQLPPYGANMGQPIVDDAFNDLN